MAEVDLHLAPVLLGDGIRLYDHPGGTPVLLASAATDASTTIDASYRPLDAGERDRPERELADDPEAGLRAVLDARVDAVRTRRLAPLRAQLADDVHSFGVLPPAITEGADAVIATTEAWFASYASDIGYETDDVRLAVDGDLGLITYRYRVTGTLQDGTDVDMSVRASLGCRRIDGRWLIVHDHESVPWTPPAPA